MTEKNRLVVVSRRFGYARHQGKKEKRRRLRQIRDGFLHNPTPTTGDEWSSPSLFISDEARYAAFGLYKV
jgi:hypothetical protein